MMSDESSCLKHKKAQNLGKHDDDDDDDDCAIVHVVFCGLFSFRVPFRVCKH
jgi:hypothetical protein